MRLFKYLLLIILAILIFINSFHISLYNYSNSYIEVELKGNAVENEVIKLSKGATFNELLSVIKLNDDADISSYSLTMPLYNKQIIIIDTIDKDIKKISINKASKDELMSLQGIGDKTAELIIEYRKTNSGFKYLEELMNIKGIGEKKFEKIKDRISL